MVSLDDFGMTEVYVLDTETTGLYGYPKDKVLDIAICKVCFGDDKVEEVYSSVVGHDVDSWNAEMKNSWIFQNSDLSLEMVRNAPSEAKVAEEVRRILNGKNVTSFNFDYDFKKFLFNPPWSLQPPAVVTFPCVMLSSKDICKIPGLYGDYKWPKLEEAYSAIVKGDPAKIDGPQAHRAMADAKMASYILIELDRMGKY